jgi:outer membrane protein OmpA-like peptidoglycan-associated protein
LEVRGHADPGEGTDLLGLARRRAELVARIAEKSGVASDRIEVRALGAFDPDERRGPRPEQSRVVVVVWAPELPELSPPKPPE